MNSKMKIIECVIDTEIFEKLSTYSFKFIEFSPKIVGLRAIIGIVDKKVVACAIMDYSNMLPNKIFYEIFYSFDMEYIKLKKEIEFLEKTNSYIDDKNSKKKMSEKYKEQRNLLEEVKSYFRYNDFYYIVFLESLVPGNHYGSDIVEYIKKKYKNLITLPYPRNVSEFWRLRGFNEINYLYYYKSLS